MDTKTFTAGPESFAAERFVNEAIAEDMRVTVNGIEVWTRFGRPASCWANGSFSFNSRARTTRGTRQNWVKEGGTINVTVEGCRVCGWTDYTPICPSCANDA